MADNIDGGDVVLDADKQTRERLPDGIVLQKIKREVTERIRGRQLTTARAIREVLDRVFDESGVGVRFNDDCELSFGGFGETHIDMELGLIHAFVIGIQRGESPEFFNAVRELMGIRTRVKLSTFASNNPFATQLQPQIYALRLKWDISMAVNYLVAIRRLLDGDEEKGEKPRTLSKIPRSCKQFVGFYRDKKMNPRNFSAEDRALILMILGLYGESNNPV